MSVLPILYYRARPASKKGGLPTHLHEAARGASTKGGKGPVDSLQAALLDFPFSI
jgi:hypothetical protein